MTCNYAYIVDADKASRLDLYRRLGDFELQTRSFMAHADFLEDCVNLAPGLVFMDVGNGTENGFDIIEAVARTAIASPIIAMTQFADVYIAVAAIRRGATDFLVKPISDEELSSVVEGCLEILSKRRVVADQMQQDRALLSRLTCREVEVLRLVAEGDGNKQIADRLGVSVRTVETHRATIAKKLNVVNSVAAVALLSRYEAAKSAQGARILIAAGKESG
ncbi:Chemotaxis protein CheY [Sphingobium herbicidovorans NBRC 16415]|uniref:Chemotaxis protein CheY n=1 Tax=Sphingobium herbicidovorans (strain ATCC 700291 / DSM 11019 / CCUG 56400 / KCTC 2939 / LMG 18315 / NBRC 16415 / MH) TaxID=1219045 RepID=A0A086P7Y1_SPHHM|nr:LuxR C-terminal-related transcriptional regulator [Sphingobium herbicidovorans]KFG89499.1 Chemotaxis protein CheY [Sphingobium herbicidovorans NBRC 16415]